MGELYNSDGSKPKAIGKIPIKNIQDTKFNRFNSGCENCGQQDYFLLHKKKVLPYKSNKDSLAGATFSMLDSETRYYISCPNCKFYLELDFKEYKNVKKCLY